MGLSALVGLLPALHSFASPSTVPDVVGDSVTVAVATLDDAGIHVDVHGAQGAVTRQHPAGGEQLFRYQDFEITYTDASGMHMIKG